MNFDSLKKKIDLETLASLVGEDTSKLALHTRLPKELNPIACEIARSLLPVEQVVTPIANAIESELNRIVTKINDKLSLGE